MQLKNSSIKNFYELKNTVREQLKEKNSSKIAYQTKSIWLEHDALINIDENLFYYLIF